MKVSTAFLMLISFIFLSFKISTQKHGKIIYEIIHDKKDILDSLSAKKLHLSFKPNKFRYDFIIDDEDIQASYSLLSDSLNAQVYMLVENYNKKYAVELKDVKKAMELSWTKSNETLKISGFKCQKYSAYLPQNKNIFINAYFTNEIIAPNWAYNTPEAGVWLQFEVFNDKNKTTFQAIDISTNAPNDILFRVSPAFEKISEAYWLKILSN